jgi:hypothetical protein
MAEESLRDTIKAAMADDGEDGGEGAAVLAAAAPEPAEAPQAAAAPVEGAESERPAEGPKRDGVGKFAKSADLAQAAASEAAAPADLEPSPEAEMIPVPAGLAAPLKAKWAELPGEWRQAFAKQEDSFKVVRDAWQPKAQRLNRLDEVFAPHRDKLTLAGIDEATWVSRLAAAEGVLERNPEEGLVYLARSYGVDPRRLVALVSGPQAVQTQQLPPELQALYGEVQTLKQAYTTQQQQAATSQQAQLHSEISAFARDPKNLYFEDVKDDIAALLSGGRADSLADAYQKAVWANPETRALLLAEQQAEAARKVQGSQQVARAANAKRAAVSVTGAPGPGASSGPAADPNNLRETIRSAFQEASGIV